MTENQSNPAQACIVGAGLASLSSSLATQDREDILLVNFWAQKATREEFDSGLNTDWFDNYRRKLAFLGWDATTPGKLSRGPDRGKVLDQALEQIAQAGSGEHAQLVQQSLTALQGRNDALNLFEASSRTGKRANFQLLPCVHHSSDYVDMVLYHMELELQQFEQRFLFLSRGAEVQVKAQRAELVRFNLRIFRDQFRPKILPKLGKGYRQSMLDLPLKEPDTP